MNCLLSISLLCEMVFWKILFTLFLLMVYTGSAFCWLGVIRRFPFNGHKNSTSPEQYTQKMDECRKDRHCQPQQFCNRYEKICVSCLTEEKKCRRNKMCCRGMECAGGVCRRKIRLGTAGALCRKDRDCNYGYCCAREEGQLVCKPMLQEGDLCAIPEGGRRYLWSHQCPCAYGLKCKNAKRKGEGILELYKDWMDGKKKRCVRSQYATT